MNPLIFCGLLALAALVGAHPEWESFKSSHGKKYGSALEESLRKTIFLQNKQKIDQFNKDRSQESTYTMGLNHLSDRTHDELAVLNGFQLPQEGYKNSMKARNFFNKMITSANDKIPDSVDWRQVEGRVSSVKDQGQTCGSCWAFSATGALEGQMITKNGKLDPLSEQNLVDCSKQNYGCSGGWMLAAWQDIKKEGGIEDESEYPYMGKDGLPCKFNKTDSVFSDDAGYVLNKGDEEMLKKTVATFGPVSVAIDSTPSGFVFYQKGVFYDKSCSSETLTHGVLVVGYGTDLIGGDYWIVKNSWAKTWGDDGYIKMARNRNNNCGIASAAMIPTF